MGFQIIVIDNQGFLAHLCIFRRNVTFNANGKPISKETKCSNCSSWRERLQIIPEKCQSSQISRLSNLLFLLEKMNYAGCPELAIYLWIRTPNTGMAQVVLVLKAKIGTRGLRMILTIFHLSLRHDPGNSFFLDYYKATLSATLIASIICKAHLMHSSPNRNTSAQGNDISPEQYINRENECQRHRYYPDLHQT